MRRLIGLLTCCLMLMLFTTTNTYGQFVIKIKGEATAGTPIKSVPKATIIETTEPCEVQANRRATSGGGCRCGADCPCGADCKADCDRLSRAPKADRLTVLLNAKVNHHLPNGTIVQKTLREATAEGAKIGQSVIYEFKMTDAEIDAVYATCRPKGTPASYNAPVAYEQPVYEVPIVYSPPVVVHPQAVQMPTYQVPTYYVPQQANSFRGFQAGFQFNGPFGGQYGAGACVGGS